MPVILNKNSFQIFRPTSSDVNAILHWSAVDNIVGISQVDDTGRAISEIVSCRLNAVQKFVVDIDDVILRVDKKKYTMQLRLPDADRIFYRGIRGPTDAVGGALQIAVNQSFMKLHGVDGLVVLLANKGVSTSITHLGRLILWTVYGFFGALGLIAMIRYVVTH